jgi:hypothetical protein
MSRTSKGVIAIASFILVIILAVLLAIYNTHHVAIPEGTVGSTAGNLNNLGLFCESDGVVYFSNSYDDGTLYSMTPMQTDIKKLYNLEASYINSAGGYVCFHGKSIGQTSGLGSVVTKPGLYMLKPKRAKIKALTSDATQSLILVGDNIFYQHYTQKDGPSLAKVSLKNYEKEDVLDYFINPASYYGGKIYFSGNYEDHHLYTFDVNTHEVSDIWSGDIYNPICDGEYVYYMDVFNNYRLCRYHIPSNTIEVITNDRIDTYNYYNGIIYYQKNSQTAPELKRINADGTNEEVILEGNYTAINITSTYTYFKEFGVDQITYFTPTFQDVNVQEFSEARRAILAGKKK